MGRENLVPFAMNKKCFTVGIRTFSFDWLLFFNSLAIDQLE